MSPQLRGLELRGHSRLQDIPPWLSQLPALECLDVSYCRTLSCRNVCAMPRLRVLAMQVRTLQPPPRSPYADLT